jgi:hypothetical protein
VVLEDILDSMTGVRFLQQLLAISWTTASILISDEPEDTLHEKTEGLGILGRIRDYGDIIGLKMLFRTFRENMEVES